MNTLSTFKFIINDINYLKTFTMKKIYVIYCNVTYKSDILYA